MKVYCLSASIDGYTGLNYPRQYFYNFEDALSGLKKVPGVGFYDDRKWDIEGSKETIVYEEPGKSITLHAIIYTGKERDDWSIRWGNARVEEIELEHEPANGKIYEIVKMEGYVTWLYKGLDDVRDDDSQPDDPDILDICWSKSYARKKARNDYKGLPRAWNNKEYDKECSPIDGNGRDYISIREYKVS